MELKVNSKKVELDGQMSILSFLEWKGINPALVVVEHNYEVPDKEKWGSIILTEGDNLEIVKFIGGG